MKSLIEMRNVYLIFFITKLSGNYSCLFCHWKLTDYNLIFQQICQLSTNALITHRVLSVRHYHGANRY